MKNEIRTLLLRDPMMTMPEVAKTLGKDPQNNKNVVIAYWKARSLLMEELTGETIGTLLNKDPIGTVYKDKDRKDPMENRDPRDPTNDRDRKDRMNEEQGPYRDPIHSVSDKEYVAPKEEPKENNEEEITIPQTWRDKGNKLYVKGRLSNTWRVYYTDQDYEEIDEKEVEERYARNDENWYDFKYQDCYYRYDNGEYTRKKEGYLFYEPIDRNKYLSAKVMSSL